MEEICCFCPKLRGPHQVFGLEVFGTITYKLCNSLTLQYISNLGYVWNKECDDAGVGRASMSECALVQSEHTWYLRISDDT